MKFKLLSYLVCLIICVAAVDAYCYQSGDINPKYNTLFVSANNQLWLGAETGLYQWTNGKTESVELGLSLQISCISEFYNFLLIGTKQGDIYSYSLEQKKIKKLFSMKAEISAFATTPTQLFIASKGNGFVQLNSIGFVLYNSKNGLRDDFLYDLQLHDKKVWCCSDNGFSVFDSTMHPVLFPGNETLPDNLVTCFQVTQHDIYFGTQRGDLGKINRSTFQFTAFDNSLWNHAQVNSCIVLDHSVCVATDQGAFMFDEIGNNIEIFVDSDITHKIVQDKEANIWWCSSGYAGSSFGEQLKLVDTIANNAINDIHAMLIDKKGSIWFTPDQGLVHYSTPNLIYKKALITPPSMQIDITSIYLNKDGYLWVGTSGKGLYRVDTATMDIEQIPLDSSEETSTVLSVSGDEHTIWIASLNGVWSCNWHELPLKFYSVEDHFNIKKFYVYQVKKDRENVLWMATDGQGIIRVHNDSIERFSLNKQMPSTVFYSVEEDGAGQHWFNASNDGLYCYSNDTLIHLNESNGLSDNDVLSIESYHDDYLVATTKKGIDLIQVNTMTVSHYYFDQQYKDVIPEMNSIANDNDQTLNIGTNKGIIHFYLPSTKSTFTPRVLIDDIAVMGNSISKLNTNFGYNENYFRFHITGIQNSNGPVYYRYQLKGLSDEWNKTYDQNIIFPRLNSGEYKLIVQAANNPAFMNASEDSFAFGIAKPFWKTWWFLTALFIALITIVYVYIRFREKRVSRMQQLENANVIAEFETLKQQVSPHFLFNSFNTLLMVIDNDTKEKALEYTQKLSDFYRSLISYRDCDLVTLNEEIALLLNYIYLQKMRFGKNLNLHISIPENVRNEIEIPPLTLQLLAENAIKHNTISSVHPLEIEIIIQEKFIMIRNNLNKKRSAEPGEGLGLQNITNRYKLFSNLPVKVNKTYTYFEVYLPILKSTL